MSASSYNVRVWKNSKVTRAFARLRGEKQKRLQSEPHIGLQEKFLLKHPCAAGEKGSCETQKIA